MVQIYRQKALQKMAAPEQLNEAVQLIDSKSRWATRFIAVVCALLVAWLFLGDIPRKTTGIGLSQFSDSGLDMLRAEAQGVVTRVLVRPGESVSAGDLLLEVDAPELEATLNSKIAEVDRARQVLESRLDDSASSIAEQEALYKSKIQQTRDRITRVEKELALARTSATLAEEQFQQQLINRSNLAQALVRVDELNTRLGSLEQALVDAKQTLADFRRNEALSTLQAQARFDAQKDELARLQRRFEAATKILTPSAGNVGVLTVSPGVSVQPGEELARIVTAGNAAGALHVEAFMKLSDAKKVQPGMQALVAFTAIQPEVYGSAVGVVDTVGLVPTSASELAEIFGDATLSGFLTAAGPVVSVSIRLLADPSTPSGFRWTSGAGYPGKIGADYQAAVSVKVADIPPINYIAPLMPERPASAG